jgi:lipoprotein NlpI
MNLQIIRIFWLVALIVCLTGCSSSSSQISGPDENTKISIQDSTSTNVLIAINSDNVAAAGYSESRSVMTVQFENGARYEYYNVPLELWESFLAAQPHPWSQVGYPRLVGEGYPYQRIN